jgi:hypothetical protein
MVTEGIHAIIWIRVFLDSKSPARGRPTRNPEEWSSRDLPRTIESARFTTDQNLPEPIEGQNRPSIEEVQGVERSQREMNTKTDLSTS